MFTDCIYKAIDLYIVTYHSNRFPIWLLTQHFPRIHLDRAAAEHGEFSRNGTADMEFDAGCLNYRGITTVVSCKTFGRLWPVGIFVSFDSLITCINSMVSSLPIIFYVRAPPSPKCTDAPVSSQTDAKVTSVVQPLKS